MTEDTPLSGKRLSEIHLPEEFLLIHIQRDGRNILPHGDTRLEPGDILTFLVREDEVSTLKEYWQNIPTEEETKDK